MELAAAWVIVWLITPQLENSHHDVHHFQVNLYMYKQLKITLIINKLLLGLKELILILYSTLFWYSYYYIYLYVCLYIHECICIDAHAHVHTHVTLCEYVSTSATVKHGCTTLRMLYDVWKAVCCKYGNKLDLIWFDLITNTCFIWSRLFELINMKWILWRISSQANPCMCLFLGTYSVMNRDECTFVIQNWHFSSNRKKTIVK